MKKLVSLLLALAMCASLTACSDDESDDFDVSYESSTSNTTGGPTDAQLNTLTDAYNQMAILYNTDINSVIEELRQLAPALEELYERVSIPYGDVG